MKEVKVEWLILSSLVVRIVVINCVDVDSEDGGDEGEIECGGEANVCEFWFQTDRQTLVIVESLSRLKIK